MVVPVIEDDASCFTRDTSAINNDLTIGTLSCSCGYVAKLSHEFKDETVGAVFDNTLSLTNQELDWSHQEPEIHCNTYPTIASTAAGSNTIATQCFNYASSTQMAFDPPTIADPGTCNDATWRYTAELSASSTDSPFPANFALSVDTVNTELNWGTADGLPIGYDPSNDYGTYQFTVKGVLDDGAFTTQDALTLDMIFDCCAGSTIVTAPTLAQATYVYSIGEP